jgi:hypothetical protein
MVHGEAVVGGAGRIGGSLHFDAVEKPAVAPKIRNFHAMENFARNFPRHGKSYPRRGKIQSESSTLWKNFSTPWKFRIFGAVGFGGRERDALRGGRVED